ncbi:MAG TPA: ribosome-associated translation inhibitor RaiA [Vicinamibacterales bacterium]|nr:ribosome-associated translation inhibitor RaiA [Vicinamibacterales bacterium]
MKLTVTGRHLTVSPAARDQVERQLRRLERLLGDSALSAQCVLSREGVEHTCELTIHARGDHTLYAKARHGRLQQAVSGAAQKVGQQAQKLKDRWKSRRKGATAAAGRRAAAPVVEPEPAPKARVVRSRANAVKPLTLDDAVLALESSRDGVVVFRQADTGGVAIVYRRPDGRVGLVEPEA